MLMLMRKIRMIFDTTDVMRRALTIRAAESGKTISATINAALEQFITQEELRRAEKLIEAAPDDGADEITRPKKRR